MPSNQEPAILQSPPERARSCRLFRQNSVWVVGEPFPSKYREQLIAVKRKYGFDSALAAARDVAFQSIEVAVFPTVVLLERERLFPAARIRRLVLASSRLGVVMLAIVTLSCFEQPFTTIAVQSQSSPVYPCRIVLIDSVFIRIRKAVRTVVVAASVATGLLGLLDCLPAGITVEGATPLKGSVYRAPLCAPVNARRCRTSGKKRGVAPSTFSPSRAARSPPGEKGPRRAQPRMPLLLRTWETPVPCGFPGKA